MLLYMEGSQGKIQERKRIGETAEEKGGRSRALHTKPRRKKKAGKKLQQIHVKGGHFPYENRGSPPGDQDEAGILIYSQVSIGI